MLVGRHAMLSGLQQSFQNSGRSSCSDTEGFDVTIRSKDDVSCAFVRTAFQKLGFRLPISFKGTPSQ